jgi:uncharacterized protein YqhQ
MPEAEYLQYGGQAIVEGVMMRSPRFFSVACRAPNGEIVLRMEPIDATWIGRQKWLKLPFLRGSLALLDSMALGHKALQFAGKVQTDNQYQKPENQTEQTGAAPASARVQDATVGIAMFFGFAIGIMLFVLLPNILAEQTRRLHVTNGIYLNLVTEAIKVVFFLSYLYGIGRIPEIKRVFMYHGAEHKAINTLEAHQDLTTENCLAQTRLHPRCGTSFAIVVLLVSLLLFTFVPRYPLGLQGTFLLAPLVRFGLELMILPLVAGFSYEMIRLAGKFRSSSFVMALFWPGLKTQYLTTVEPEADQVEVALAALKAVVDAEKDASNPVQTVQAAATA